MNNTLEKIVTALVAGGAIVAGTMAGIDKAQCDIAVETPDGTVCISTPEFEAAKHNLESAQWDNHSTWDDLK